MNKYEDEIEISISDFLIEWLLHYKSIIFLCIITLLSFSACFFFYADFKIVCLFVCAVIILNLSFSFIKYISKHVINHGDNIYFYLNINEFTHIIDWKKFKNMNSYCRFLWNLRLKYENRNSYQDSIKVNASAISNLIKENSYNKIALICFDLKAEGKEMTDILSQYNPEIEFTCLSSIALNYRDMMTINDCESVVLLGRFRHTTYDSLYQEINALNIQNKSILGIILYE